MRSSPQEKFAKARKGEKVNSEASGPSQRRYFRAPVDFTVAIIIAEREPPIAGHAEELSGGGMRFTTEGEISAGQTVALRFTLPDDSTGTMMRGRVVFAFYDNSRKLYAHGLAFTQISESDQKKIVDHIHELQQRTRV